VARRPSETPPKYSALSETAPPSPARSPLVPSGVQSRQRKKWRADNAKWRGQMRALSKLSPPPEVTPLE